VFFFTYKHLLSSSILHESSPYMMCCECRVTGNSLAACKQTKSYHISIYNFLNITNIKFLKYISNFGWGGGVRASAPVQTDPGTHQAFYTMGTGSLPEVKRPGRGIDHPPQSSNEVREIVELYLYSPTGPSWLLLG